ncbi:MAG: recombination-associated protein RdgC, partial [Spongiibacteraceae bacterium]|nr:recombination-associated protein RdgC [Spongiibacteraceae bacterium]
MWFKNALLYRLTGPIEGLEHIEARLAQTPYVPCGSQDMQRIGWTPAMPESEELSHQANGYVLVCLRKQQKILPGAAVAEALDERIRKIETEQGRKVYRKERKELKEEVTIDLLPRALTRSSRAYAFIDTQRNLIVVDSSSRTRAEELLTQLRKDLGSLPLEPLETRNQPTALMTDWLNNNSLPAGFALGQQCELRDARESSNVVRVRGQDLRSDEVLQHIEVGKQVTRLELHWNEAVDCVL